MNNALFGAAALNQPKIGQPGSRRQLETPAAVLDLPMFERNVSLLAGICAKAGIHVRPHAKSHKCAEIARRQIAAGAVGNCCAKPGELLALHAVGIDGLLLTAPVASAAKIDALARATAQRGPIGVVVDRADLVDAYGQAARRHGGRFDVFIDLDVGLLRSGVSAPEQAVALARRVTAQDSLNYAGVQAYQGRVQHIANFDERCAANRAMEDRLSVLLDALAQAGLPPRIVSGGGTGSHLIDAERRLFTEIQPGSYVFMDEAYQIDMHGRGGAEFDPALRIAVTVVGHSSAGFAITDGGSKSFAIDGPPPRVFQDGKMIGKIEWCGDEFGRILPGAGEMTPPIGTVVECTVPHCDPTINLHDFLHIVSGDALIDLWPVEARGRAD